MSVAEQLVNTGHVVVTNSENDARAAMVDAWFDAVRNRQTLALVTSTHNEAQGVSEAIQARRIDAKALDVSRYLLGRSTQAIYEGGIVQTRRNDARYVGRTRGRSQNAALLVAFSEASARAQLVEAMQRQVIEETMEKSRAAARTELNRAARSSADTVVPTPNRPDASIRR